MMSRPPIPPPPPKWVLDINEPPTSKAHSKAVPDPPGFTAVRDLSSAPSKRSKQSASIRVPASTAETDTLKVKKSWEVALASAKQLPMNAVMMYMSGNSLQIFSIMMVFMLFKTPIQGLLGINQAFARFETDGTRSRLWAVKAVYVLMQLLALGLGVWKVNGMGLLPTTRSDWLAWETERIPLEHAIPAF